MANVNIIEDLFGTVPDPITGETQNIRRFTFTNDNGVSVQVITYGATITSIRCPDKFGNIADIVLGFDDIEGINKTIIFIQNRHFQFSIPIQ